MTYNDSGLAENFGYYKRQVSGSRKIFTHNNQPLCVMCPLIETTTEQVFSRHIILVSSDLQFRSDVTLLYLLIRYIAAQAPQKTEAAPVSTPRFLAIPVS